jgi:exonuclease III
MSSSNKEIQLKKILGISKLCTDVIFLSDVRISNRNLVSNKQDVSNLLRTNKYASYHAYFNSTKNKRGVAILFNNNLCFSVEDQLADKDENYILLKTKLRGDTYILGAIYRPNNHDENFFQNLSRDLQVLGNFPVIIGGTGT